MVKVVCAALILVGDAGAAFLTLQNGSNANVSLVRKQLIAHRGASAYAPEHTLAAYQVALDQKADFVEPDLAISKDGVLICLHDDSLERTSNVAEVFPDRFSREDARGDAERSWLANDFTVDDRQRRDGTVPLHLGH
jgi:glycerophosphoryl diester phosphodiesterase